MDSGIFLLLLGVPKGQKGWHLGITGERRCTFCFFFSTVSPLLHVVTCHRGADFDVGEEKHGEGLQYVSSIVLLRSAFVVLLETGILEGLYFSCSLLGLWML